MKQYYSLAYLSVIVLFFGNFFLKSVNVSAIPPVSAIFCAACKQAGINAGIMLLGSACNQLLHQKKDVESSVRYASMGACVGGGGGLAGQLIGNVPAGAAIGVVCYACGLRGVTALKDRKTNRTINTQPQPMSSDTNKVITEQPAAYGFVTKSSFVKQEP